MQRIFSKIIIFILFVVLLLPAISLAGLKLQQNYPAISGITTQSQSLNTAVSQTQKNSITNTVSLIKYVFTLTAVVLIGITTLALIISGVQYLSSAGKVAAQKLARTRLVKSSLGLAIVVLSTVIFQVISPNLDLPQITHIYSVSNVVLISKAGMMRLDAEGIKITKEYLDQLSDEDLVRYFGSQSGDLTQNFGQLTRYRDFDVSFEDFQPAYIGFFGSGAENIQVKTFAGKNFLGASNIFKTTGPESAGMQVIGGAGNPEIFYLDLPTYLATASNIDWFDTTAGNPEEPQPASKAPSKYPPLSMSVEGISSGVYLYGSDNPVPIQSEDQSPNVIGDTDTNDYVKYVGGKGGQRYLQYDIPNFSDTAFDFDNQAMQIEVKNNRGKDASVQDDLLVFLFQGANYQGPFRAFFEKKNGGSGIDQVPIATIFTLYPQEKWYESKDNQDTISRVFNGTENENVSFVTLLDSRVGNTQENEKININAVGQQGKVIGASSARVFHLAKLDGVSKRYNESSCEAVALCNGENLQGYCLVFTANNTKGSKYMSFFLPMPWFTPITLPNRFPGRMKDLLIASPEQQNAYKEEKNTKGFKDNTEFNDNIKSIGIKGNCVVALYDNAVKNFYSCLSGNANGENTNDCWDGKTPGEKSMVFSTGDMISGVGEGQMPYLNLKNYPIHTCVSLESFLRLSKPHSCVSAVAVYPIK